MESAVTVTTLSIHPTHDDLAWEQRGLCSQTDPELFFPTHGGIPHKAKAICARCPVREPCLDRAIEIDDREGVWGGLTYRERRKVMRRRGIKLRPFFRESRWK